MDSIGDRRKHPRFPVHLPVSIFYKEKRAVGHTLDVGLGGMKIYTDQILPSRWELLFQLVLGGKFIWVKGRFVFAQTQPESVNFFCIQFLEARKENLFILHEYLSGLEDLIKKERNELEERIRKGEAAPATAHELLEIEYKRWKEGERVCKELDETLRDLSSKFLDHQETKIKLAIKEVYDGIDAMILAILKSILTRIEKGNFSDHITFEQIIFNIQRNYKEIRRILENVWPSISGELGIPSTIRIQNEKEIDIREETRSVELDAFKKRIRKRWERRKG
jgi:DNA-binding ferritin-like protein